MKKTLFSILVLFTFSSLVFLTGCQKDNETTTPEIEQVAIKSLPYSKVIRVFDQSGTYWVDMTLSSDKADGIDQMIAMKPYIKVYSKDNPAPSSTSTNYTGKLEESKLSSEDREARKNSDVLSISVGETNIPKNMIFETGYGATEEEMQQYFRSKNNTGSNLKVTSAASYQTYQWTNATYRGVKTTVVGYYTVPITYYNKSGSFSSWRNCGTITHTGPNYSYTFCAFATANSSYSTGNPGVQFSAYTTYPAAQSISYLWMWPL